TSRNELELLGDWRFFLYNQDTYGARAPELPSPTPSRATTRTALPRLQSRRVHAVGRRARRRLRQPRLHWTRGLGEFIGSMAEGMGRIDRREALTSYAVRLLLDGERTSIGPMAARLVDDL
ncbi:MAG TPA: hypothetical protein VMK12_20810, partial [Anaeromyxobacteraceae bacterium]|nr:hypothetical protein [Anaeromyxobacteraceae bacterium]